MSELETEAGGKQLKTLRCTDAITDTVLKMAPKQAVTGMVHGPRSLSSFVPKLTSKAFEKFGFPKSALLMEWAEIAGPDLASFTRPEKLTWPRRPHNDYNQTGQSDGNDMNRRGATLVLRVDGPRAIEVQHSATQIKEQINAYFGYRAVTELRFLQAPITTELPRSAIAPKPARKKPMPNKSLPTGEKPASKLEASLARLAGHLELAD